MDENTRSESGQTVAGSEALNNCDDKKEEVKVQSEVIEKIVEEGNGKNVIEMSEKDTNEIVEAKSDLKDENVQVYPNVHERRIKKKHKSDQRIKLSVSGKSKSEKSRSSSSSSTPSNNNNNGSLSQSPPDTPVIPSLLIAADSNNNLSSEPQNILSCSPNSSTISSDSPLSSSNRPTPLSPRQSSIIFSGRHRSMNISLDGLSPPSTPPLSPREVRVRHLSSAEGSIQSKEEKFMMVQKLCIHSSEGNIVGVKQLLMHFPYLAHLKNFRGQTCLYCACLEGHVAVVIEILKVFPISEIDTQDSLGLTALHASVQSKKKNLIALLLFRGAKSNILNMQGMSPIQESSGELSEVFTVFEKEGKEGLKTNFPVVSYLPPSNNYTLEYIQSQQLFPEFVNFLSVWNEKVHQYVSYYWEYYRYSQMSDFEERTLHWKTVRPLYDILSKEFNVNLQREDSNEKESSRSSTLLSPEKLKNIIVKAVESDIQPFYSFLELKENADLRIESISIDHLRVRTNIIEGQTIITISLPYGGKKRIIMNEGTNIIEEIEKICAMRNWSIEDFNLVNEEGVPILKDDSYFKIEPKTNDKKKKVHRPSGRVFLELRKPGQNQEGDKFRDLTGGGVISTKSGVPQNLFVILLTDGTKKTLSCSPEEQSISVSAYLKKKKDSNNFTDDYNMFLDKNGQEVSPETIIKDIADRFICLEKKEGNEYSGKGKNSRQILVSKRDSLRKNLYAGETPKKEKQDDKISDSSNSGDQQSKEKLASSKIGSPGQQKRKKLESLFQSKNELKVNAELLEKPSLRDSKAKGVNIFGTSTLINDIIAYTVLNVSESDSTFFKFLLIYPQWLTSAYLLQRVLSMSKWCRESSKPKILEFLVQWLTLYYPDFSTTMLNDVRKFVEENFKEVQESSFTSTVLQLLEGHTKKLQNSRKEFDLVRENSAPSKAVRNLKGIVSNKQNAMHSICFLQFDVVELAQQMTLYDQQQLLKVPREELLQKRYSIPEQSPFLQAITVTFNIRTQWILTELITADSVECKYILTNFILLAEKLFLFGNMHGFLAIIMGLSQGQCTRLSSWKIISNTVKAKWEKLSEMCNPNKNFKSLREAFDNFDVPKISSPSLFIRDLTMLDEGAKNWIDEDEKINLDKFNVLSDILHSVLEPLQTSYNFVVIDIVQDYLGHLFYLDNTTLETLYDRRKHYENYFSETI